LLGYNWRKQIEKEAEMQRSRKPASPSRLTPEEEAQYAAERAEMMARIAKLPKSPIPKSGVDERGRLLPLPENYLEIQTERTKKMLERWAEMPDDDPPGAHEEAMKGIDEERRRLGMRTLFDGYVD
jgi:hypothetical protein